MRNILFLQGIPGASMRLIGEELARHGAKISRINFNGGDCVNGRFSGISYRGKLANFRPWLSELCREKSIDSIVLFGSSRPFHRAAIALALAEEIDIFALEEGYLRPNSVTLEFWPKGQQWQAPNSLEQCHKCAENLPAGFAEAPVPARFKRRLKNSITYWTSATLGMPFFPFYRSHRINAAPLEMLYWIKRWLFRGTELRQSQEALTQVGLGSELCNFFLLPLQLDGDAALSERSNFASMGEAARGIISSFAADAPQNAKLLINLHPYDPDLANWRRAIADLAQEYSLQTRLHFVEKADLGPLLDQCRGVVTINSTVGQLALEKRTPVLALGDAHYALPGLTHQGSLQSFWNDPAPPQSGAYRAYARALWSQCLVNGGFHSDAALSMLAKSAAARILKEDP